MAFVDGENLTARYEAMVKEGWTPQKKTRGQYTLPDVIHEPGRFVWSTASIFGFPAREELLRTIYYTTFSGSSDDLERFTAMAASQKVVRFQDENQTIGREAMQLVPRVFLKTARGTRTKSVDINLSVDLLEYIRQNALDAVMLITGDVDYLPLIEATMRAGKKVYVAALSSGLSPKLRHCADRFISLDRTYFSQPPATRAGVT